MAVRKGGLAIGLALAMFVVLAQAATPVEVHVDTSKVRSAKRIQKESEDATDAFIQCSASGGFY